MSALEHKNGIITIPDLERIPDSNGVGCFFFDSMSRNKNKIAQIDAITNEEDLYENLLNRCIQAAIVMRRSYGVTPGDNISTCSLNHLNSCVPMISSLFLGATVSSFDPSLSETETFHLFKLVKPKLTFVSVEGLTLIENAVKETGVSTEIIVFGENSAYTSFSTFLRDLGKAGDFVPYTVEDTSKDAFILFSSGTTGLPKGLCISHSSYLGQIRAIRCSEYTYTRLLPFATLYWSSALVFCGYAICNGTTRIVIPKFDAEKVWEVVSRNKVDLMFISPYQIITLHDTNLSPDLDITCLKSIAIGGGTLSKEKIADIRQHLPSVQVSLVYGLSESGFVTLFQHSIAKHAKYSIQKPGSSGLGMKGFSYKVVDVETEKVLGANQKGEVRLKSNYTLTGYYQLDSSSIWDSDGWLKTGDVGYYDDDYCFYIVDRIKQMLKFRSFHVLPALIENTLHSHPSVKYAVALGIPHEKDGDHPCAVVVLQPYGKCTTAQELMTFVEQNLGDWYKLRGGVTFIDEMPLLPTGKINVKAVKAMIINKIV